MRWSSILVHFPPYVRRRLTSPRDRHFVQHGCYGNCSSSGFTAAAIIIGVLLRKQSERSAPSVRDVETQSSQTRLSRRSAFSLKGYVWAKNQLGTFAKIHWLNVTLCTLMSFDFGLVWLRVKSSMGSAKTLSLLLEASAVITKHQIYFR